MELIKNPNFNIIGRRNAFLGFFAVLMVASIISLVARGLNMGVDFRGGTLVNVRFTVPIEEDNVRQLMTQGGLSGSRVQRYGSKDSKEMLIALEQHGSEANLEQGREQILRALQNSPYAGKFEVRNVEIVGPQVGDQLRSQARWAILASMGGILLYLAVRFRLIYGGVAVLAVLLDVLITLGFFSFFGEEISLTVVAGLLTLAGYSMNDKIVIFDRIRENLRIARRESFDELVNRSINQTFNRTLLTAGPTFLTLFALYIFGGEALRGFALALVIGIVIGTISSFGFAAPLLVLYQHKRGQQAILAGGAQRARG